MNIPALKNRLCLVGFLFAVVAKFWLIWESEIADALDDPHEYVLQILFPLNGGLAYPPGTGMIGRFFRDLDIPFRLGIEITFIVAAVLVIRALFTWPWKGPLALGLFTVVIFDPSVAALFTRIGSDEGWLIETMLGTSLFVLAWRVEGKPSWPLLAVAAICLGFSTITRSVIVPLLLALITFTALTVILLRAKKNHPGTNRTLAEFGLGLCTLLLGVLLFYNGTCAYNFSCHGYHGISVIDSTEYKRFYLSLASVGEPTGQKYFSIDQDRRNLIAQAGPTSKWLMTELDHNDTYRKIGLTHYGSYDIPSGWFEFAVFNAALPAAHGDLRQCYALFATIEGEIADANRRGVIHVRSIVPLPDSRLSIVVREYPGALAQAFNRILGLPPPDALIADAGGKQYVDPDFTTALLRRAIHPSPVRDKIWELLCAVYAWIFTPAILYFALALVILFKCLFVFRWYQFERFPSLFLARQFFIVLFIVLVFWYALFDASGRPVLARYMILNHILLVPLICYYFSATVRLFRSADAL